MTVSGLKYSILLMLLVSATCSLPAQTSQSTLKSRYFEPGKSWPDNNGVHINAHGGGIIRYNTRYYWFGEHKTAGPEGNTAMVGFSCYSSDNLYDWKNEGIVLKVSEDTTSPIRKGCIMERPNAGFWPINVRECHKKGVPNSTKDHYGGGPDVLPGHPDSLNLLGRDFSKGQMARDMTLFVDDDGKAYHIYSSEENSTTQLSLLTDDYLWRT
jgi:hypothetical protein